MDARLILAGRGINPVAAFDAADVASQNALATNQAYAMRDYYRQNGAQVLAGDQNALAGLAQIGPLGAQQAFDARANIQAEQTNSFNLEQAKIEAAQQTEAHLAKMSADQIAQEADNLRRLAETAALAKDPMQWDNTFRGTPYEGTWDKRGAVLAILGTQKEVLDRIAPPAPDAVEPLSPEGKLAWDQKRGFLPEPVAGAAIPVDPKAEMDLRKEYNTLPEVKDFKSQTSAFASLQSAAQRAQGEKNGAADIALVFAFMKTLDPTSTVREGEFAAAAKSGSFGETIANIVSKIENGEILTDEQRAKFVETAARIYSGGRNSYRDTLDIYQGIAADQGLDINRTVPNYEPTAPLVSGRPVTRGQSAAPTAPLRLKFDPATGEFK